MKKVLLVIKEFAIARKKKQKTPAENGKKTLLV